ncbi:hypothetical protein MRX96_019803 [Rhipicephalus microplus]
MRQPLEVVRDDQQSTEHESVFRANLADEDAVNEWMEAYSVRTNTSWIVCRVQSAGERIQLSAFKAAFKLLKEAHPLCFEGQPAPQVMYADTAEKLEAATAEVKALQHDAFVSRVLTFLRRQEEWVQLYRLDVLTRGHNTNNFAEATIRVLKDIILNRVEAFNAVAFVDSVALVWEKYFESRILCHAYSRVAAHQLLYKRLLSRMPKDAAEAIQVVGQGQYIVPSATHPSSSYEVYADIGLCTCLFGKQGAFCKHQALVQKKYGGLFPNAPALSTDDRYELGQLALGEKCPPRIFFKPFQEEEPSSSSRTTAGTSAQQEEPDEVQAMQGTSTHARGHTPRTCTVGCNRPALLGVGQGLQGGFRRVPTGRPAVEPAAKRAKKRPHSLSHSIEKNVPGARLH